MSDQLVDRLHAAGAISNLDRCFARLMARLAGSGDRPLALAAALTSRASARGTSASGAMRKFDPYRLPEHETVFAMTIHKSQGTEFDRVLLVLPESDARVLTRELLYTGVTRARKRVDVWAGEAALRAALSRRIERVTGLRDALWAEGTGNR